MMITVGLYYHYYIEVMIDYLFLKHDLCYYQSFFLSLHYNSAVMKREFCLILFLTFVCMSYSQKKKGKPFSSFAENVIRKYTDSLTQVKTYYDTQWRYEKEDLLNNPY